MVLPLLQTATIIFEFTFWLWLMTLTEGNRVLDLPPKLKEHFLFMTTHEFLTLGFSLGWSESKIFLQFSHEGNCVEVDLFNRSLRMRE